MSNPLLLLVIAVLVTVSISSPVMAAITTNAATVSTVCVVMSGTNSGTAESVWFDYGHINNTKKVNGVDTPAYFGSTANRTVSGTFNTTRCDEPVFLAGHSYHYRACGKTSGCGSAVTFTMPALVPHGLSNFSVQGEAFIANGGDPSWMAAHIWDVYSLVWGSYFLLLLISFVFMNVTIKQKSVTISLILMLISGSALFTLAGMPIQLQAIGGLLVLLALTGLVYWLYKKR